MPKILIIEDEKSIQRMIEYDLNQLGYDVDSSFDGFEGYKKASNTFYDAILLDLMLPNMNGMDICKKLRDEGNTSYIIMLTAIDDEFSIIKGFDLGADDYITKPFSPRELYYNGLKIVQSSYEVFHNDKKIELTLKEFDLLTYLVINKGKALSRDQLLTNLWGFNYDGDSRIVDVHIFKLRDKIDPKAECLKTVRGVGYKLI